MPDRDASVDVLVAASSSLKESWEEEASVDVPDAVDDVLPLRVLVDELRDAVDALSVVAVRADAEERRRCCVFFFFFFAAAGVGAGFCVVCALLFSRGGVAVAADFPLFPTGRSESKDGAGGGGGGGGALRCDVGAGGGGGGGGTRRYAAAAANGDDIDGNAAAVVGVGSLK